MQKSQEIIRELCERYGLVIQEKIVAQDDSQATYSAFNNDGVYRVTNKFGLAFILKVGLTKKAIAEILMNDIGYQKLRNLGLEWFIPRVLATEISGQFGMMLMEDCGEGFLSQTRQSAEPLKLYTCLLDGLEKAYIASRRKADDGKRMVESIIALVIKQYEEYIYMKLDRERVLAGRLAMLKSSIDISDLEFCCFASWDFVPENVFVTHKGVKYIDPHEDVTGIPIIDMACFAGLIKLYNLPEADKGYKMFQEFALGAIPSILHIREELARKLFFLGKILQCFMSTRFRLASHPDQARRTFSEGKEYLERIVEI